MKTKTLRENRDWSQDTPVMLSIVVATYNHDKFIEEAIESFLMQEVNFKVEILINDDASTDTSAAIIKKYEDKYPGLFHNFYQSENQYSKGIKPWIHVLFPAAKGKYIALCEGDDYWTDPLKLQKQVEFLEENSEYALCEHVVEEVNQKTKVSMQLPAIEHSKDFLIEEYIENNKGATCSLVFKRQALEVSFLEKLTKYPFGDWPIKLYLLKKSNHKSRILKDAMGVYRIHDNSIHGSMRGSNPGLILAYKQHLSFINLIQRDLLTEKTFEKPILKKKISTLSTLLKLSNNSFEKLPYFIQLSYLKLIKRLK